MKIIYSGGYQRELEASYKNSWWYRHADILSSDIPTAVVTLAKPDGSYDQHLKKIPMVEVIDRNTTSVDWAKYKAVFIAGGPTDVLREEMLKRDFDIRKLDHEAMVLGDSAGAYIMCSSFFTDSDGDPGKKVEFYEGFNPGAKNICVAHADNPYYTNNLLIRQVTDFASEHSLEVVKLKENEERILDI
ncbi:MAG TPA: Type 1 glutamine amidotransferase-like domain-containing protein [Candidatus Saccharimonadales bacterium]|nr:Type 1 glutamine amidotransferase-like domain-containing protein [Candidatus Saccharimonadales bacterium]